MLALYNTSKTKVIQFVQIGRTSYSKKDKDIKDTPYTINCLFRELFMEFGGAFLEGVESG